MEGKWICPKCKWCIAVQGNNVFLSNEQVSDKQRFDRTFPAHLDCELGKPLDEIDFSILKPVN